MSDYELHADYDRNGTLTASPDEYRRRTNGAIVLPNLDADRRKLPVRVEKGGPVTLDREQPVRTADDNEMLPLRVRVVKATAPAGSRFFLQVAGELAARVGLFDRSGHALTADAKNGTPLDLAAPQLDLQLELRTLTGTPLRKPGRVYGMGEEDLSLQLVAVDAAGAALPLDEGRLRIAPFFIPTTNAPMTRLYICDQIDNEPSRRDVQAALATTGVPLILVPREVSPSDAWLQDQFQHGVVHGPAGLMHVILHLPRVRADAIDLSFTAPANLASFVTSHFASRDVAVFQDFWDRTLPVAAKDGSTIDLGLVESFELGLIMNVVPTVRRALDGFRAAIEAPELSGKDWFDLLENLEAQFEETFQLLEAAKKDPAKVQKIGAARLDRFLGRRKQLALLVDKIKSKLPFDEDLATLPLSRRNTTVDVSKETADRLFVRLDQAHSSGNAGGNIEAAPPTSKAPFGTVVVGNVRTDNVDSMDPDLLHFLDAQGLQPVVQIDTGWLKVGHVDEIVAFVPATPAPGFVIARAAPGVGMALLRAAKKRAAPVTAMLRGKVWLHLWPKDAPQDSVPPEIYRKMSSDSPNRCPFIAEHGERHYPAVTTVDEFLLHDVDSAGTSVNDALESDRLLPLEKTLQTALDNAPVCRLPVLFDAVRTSTVLFLPDMLNMQVVNNHLLLPKPYGPRMKPADAIAVVGEVLKQEGLERLATRLTPQWLTSRGLDRTKVWIKPTPGITIETLGHSQFLFRGYSIIAELAEVFADGFPGQDKDEVLKRIKAANPNAFSSLVSVKEQWQLFTIPETTVDLFEAYAQAVLEELGAAVHWVDAWFYHVRSGGIHCGTNGIRQPDVRSLKKWWLQPEPAQ